MTTIDSFWSIPPIQDAIALHLERIDYWNCIQVSKSLNEAFIPHLWKVIKRYTIWDLSVFLASPGQPRFGHFLKELHLRDHEIPLWERLYSTCGAFPNLNKVDMISSTNVHVDEFMTLAVHHEASLVSLQLYFTCDAKAFLDRLPTFRSKLTHLKCLTLMLNHAITLQSLIRILESCASIQDLELQFWNNLQSDPLPLMEANFQLTKIRRIVLWLGGHSLDSRINQFLAFCPDLEHLSWPTTTEVKDASGDIGAVLAAHCSNLKELCLSESVEDSEDLDRILTRCARLTKLALRVPIYHNSILQTIISRHSMSLKDLDLSNGNVLMVDDLFMVANTCLHLKRLAGHVGWSLETQAFQETLTRLKTQPWGFKNLEQLKLVFTWLSSPEDYAVREGMERKIEADAAVMDALYCQIGRLRFLQDLALKLYHVDAPFAVAFIKGMDHLAGLQWLRRFYFSDCANYPLKKEELKRIVRSWKRLEAFGGLSGMWLQFSPEEVARRIRALCRNDG